MRSALPAWRAACWAWAAIRALWPSPSHSTAAASLLSAPTLLRTRYLAPCKSLFHDQSFTPQVPEHHGFTFSVCNLW